MVVRIGLALPQYDYSVPGESPLPWDTILEHAQRAEALGFDSLWLSDHLFLDIAKYGGSDERHGVYEPLVTLAALARSVTRPRLGTLVVCEMLRPAAVLAKALSTLDRIAGGRLDVGLGAGWYEPEYRAAGIDFRPPGERIRALGEGTQIIRRLLEGEVVDFDGRHYRLRGAACRPGPVQEPSPPLWLGGKGDMLLRTAARHADGWNFSWIGSIDAYAARARVADETCERLGRDPRSLRRSVGAYVLVGDTDAGARRRFERLTDVTPAGVLRDDAGGRGVSWEEFRRDHLAGTAAEVIERMGHLKDIGVEEVVVGLGTLPFQVADEDDIERFGTEIAAAFR
jgi:probable F420-dependent oxidoreductase